MRFINSNLETLLLDRENRNSFRLEISANMYIFPSQLSYQKEPVNANPKK
jgi:hypothetical protein